MKSAARSSRRRERQRPRQPAGLNVLSALAPSFLHSMQEGKNGGFSSPCGLLRTAFPAPSRRYGFYTAFSPPHPEILPKPQPRPPGQDASLTPPADPKIPGGPKTRFGRPPAKFQNRTFRSKINFWGRPPAFFALFFRASFPKRSRDRFCVDLGRLRPLKIVLAPKE